MSSASPQPLNTDQSCEDEPGTVCPDTKNPDIDNPCLEIWLQLNKDRKNTDLSNTKGPNPILLRFSTGANWTEQGWVHEPEPTRNSF